MLWHKSQGAGGVGGGELETAIEEVFSTYNYTGTNSTQTITNGIDLAGEGGLVWLKRRSAQDSHVLLDTERGPTYELWSNNTNGNVSAASKNFSFLSDGFSMNTGDGQYNLLDQRYVSWSWRKAPRFFDCVTYTGDGTANRTISHNLGVAPGCIVVKRTDTSADWVVWHRSLDNSGSFYEELVLNTTALAGASGRFPTTEPTSTEFYVNQYTPVNANGGTYVAYLFAHDPLGPSGDGSDGLISCGTYYATGGDQEIDLGWEPQWLLVKNASNSGDWCISDNMRGTFSDAAFDLGDRTIIPNSAAAESTFSGAVSFTSNGFSLDNSNSRYNDAGETFIYMAIRRGPMRQPTSGTEVFDIGYGNNVSGAGVIVPSSNLVDMFIQKTDGYHVIRDRHRGEATFNIGDSGSEAGSAYYHLEASTGVTTPSSLNWNGYIHWMFTRAPGFFDMLSYKGNGTSRTIKHNLGVEPEMAWFRNRYGQPFVVYLKGQSNTGQLNSSDPFTYSQYVTAATEDSISLTGDSYVNSSSYSYAAYLFATLPGISKVGTYTGNSSTQTIDCGFTTGARFVLIKRIDGTSGFPDDWFVWDSVRGIVAGGNDPNLKLNTQDSGDNRNSLEPNSSGFSLTSSTYPPVNNTGSTYLFYAIA